MSDAPDLIQPVIGYRGWNLTHPRRLPDGQEDEYRLISGGPAGAVWEPATNRAECKLLEMARLGRYGATDDQLAAGYHEAPAPNCACGFYGYNDLASGQGGVTGAIAAWGRIEVHRHGFRAEYARVVALALHGGLAFDKDQRKAIEAIAERYGVKAVPLIHLEAEAREHGIAVPEELRPEAEEPGLGQPGPGSSIRMTLYGRALVGMSAVGTGLAPAGFASGGRSAIASPSRRPRPSLPSRPSSPQAPPRPLPGKKRPGLGAHMMLAFTIYASVVLPLYALPWGSRIALGVAAAIAFAVPLYRRLLRLRCVFEPGNFFHGSPAGLRCDQARSAAGLITGDHCPRCGWRLRRCFGAR